MLLGVDKDRVWTTEDAVDFEGNTTLLPRLKPLKHLINLCEPLARTETKGKPHHALYWNFQYKCNVFIRKLITRS